MLDKSQIFFYALMFYIAGIILGNFFDYQPFVFFVLTLTCGWLAVISRDNWRLLLIFLCCLFFGLWRFQFSLPDFSDSTGIYHHNSSTVEFNGQVKRVSTSPGWQSLIVASKGIKEAGRIFPAGGLVKVESALYPEYFPGDYLSIKCRLNDYRAATNEGYRHYLFKENIFSTCSFADIKFIKSRSTFNRLIYRINKYAEYRINSTIKEPAASIVNGMLLNNTKNIPSDLNLLFSQLGLTHIIAISGSHLVIVVFILSELLIFCGISRSHILIPTAIFIIFYIILVGAPASAVRSAIMVLLLMYAQSIGRLSGNKSLLALAAALMALFNPKIILFDVGFQLSFLAVIGLSYFSPRLERYLKFLPETLDFRKMAAATLSAQLLTYPLIIFYFGTFSPYSLLANLLILPVVPLLMGWSILNLAIALLSISLAKLCGLLTFYLVYYWVNLAELLVLLPGSHSTVKINWHLLLIVYVTLYCFYAHLTKKGGRCIIR